MRILTKPWLGRGDGRLVVLVKNKVVFSKHYCDFLHREKLIREINKVIGR